MLLSFCLIYCQLEPGHAYKSVAYKTKSMYLIFEKFKHTTLNIQNGLNTFRLVNSIGDEIVNHHKEATSNFNNFFVKLKI